MDPCSVRFHLVWSLLHVVENTLICWKKKLANPEKFKYKLINLSNSTQWTALKAGNIGYQALHECLVQKFTYFKWMGVHKQLHSNKTIFSQEFSATHFCPTHHDQSIYPPWWVRVCCNTMWNVYYLHRIKAVLHSQTDSIKKNTFTNTVGGLSS